MSKFMFVVRGGPIIPQRMLPDELQSHLRKWSDWVGTLAKDGCHIGGSPLENRGARSTARSARCSKGRRWD